MFYKPKLLAILSIFLTIALGSCGESIFYQSELELPESGWESDKAAVFDFNISDTLKVYDLKITISNNDDYRKSNLWLFVRTHGSKGEIAGDTLEYRLANEKGKWLGKKNGDIWQIDFYYKSKIRFPETGNYSIEIVQGMRELNLKGIKSVGLKIEELK